MTGFAVRDSDVRSDEHRVAIRRYEPDGEPADAPPTLVWLHGGGFFRGSVDQPEADAVARALAGRGIPVVTAGYRLAPLPIFGRINARGSHPRVRFPLPAEDVSAVVAHERGQSPRGLLLGGASAGACLAAAVARRGIETRSAPRVDGVVLAYGFFHARLPRNAQIRGRVRGHRRVSHAPLMLDAANLNYAGSRAALANPSAFPGGHDLRGFPATLMIDADRDVMRASGETFAHELVSAGADVERHVLGETRHAFLNRPHLPEFAAAIDRIASWILTPR